MARAGPAKALGRSSMYGSLAKGADGNVAIYNLDANTLPSDPELIEAAFQNTAYTVKEGVVVVKDGDIVAEPHKYTLWTKVNGIPDNTQLMHDLKEKFDKNYTVNFDNYAVFDEHLHNPRAIEVEVA